MPALVLALALAAMARYRAPANPAARPLRARPREVARAFVIALPALVLPVLIRASVVEGIATATEVSTIGIVYTLLVGPLVYRQNMWRRFYPILVDTAALSGAILFIIGCATAMAWALTQSGLGRALAGALTAVRGGSMGFLAASVVGFVVLGSLLEGIPAMVLLGPLLFPIARTLGVQEVHYAMTVILAMGLGLFAPPFGVGYYAACSIGRVDPNVGLRAIWPYLGAVATGLVLVAAVPWLSTAFLP